MQPRPPEQAANTEASEQLAWLLECLGDDPALGAFLSQTTGKESNDLATTLAEIVAPAVSAAVLAHTTARGKPPRTRAPDADIGVAYAEYVTPRLEPRPVQLEYARAVSAAFQSGGVLAIEAGTGTGKTAGYLLAGYEHVTGGPDRRFVVATSTVALRDQARKAADEIAGMGRFSGLTTDTFKSRSSYLCPAKVGAALVRAASQATPDLAQAIARDVKDALCHGGEFGSEPEPSGQTGCGRPCGFSCPAAAYQRRALAADVVVTTHASLARLAHPELIGLKPRTRADTSGHVCVVDEADLFPHSLRLALRRGVSVPDLIKTARAVASREAAARARSVNAMVDPFDFSRKRWSALALRRTIVSELEAIRGLLRPGLDLLVKEARASADAAPEAFPEQTATRNPKEAADRVRRVLGDLDAVLDGQEAHEWLHTVSRTGGSLAFHREPFVISALAGGALPGYGAVVYTSATLKLDVGPQVVSPFAEAIGDLDPGDIVAMPPPYDVGERVAAVVAAVTPRYDFEADHTKRAEWLRSVARCVSHVALPLGGRTLVLLTSREDMRGLSDTIGGSLEYDDHWVKDQDMPGALEWFRRGKSSVLIGLSAMWTGIDIKGDLLSAVVVPRLPYSSPDSPEAWQLKGHDWDQYRDGYAAPAALLMRQALGRIVRDSGDRGVFVCLDERIDGERFAEYKQTVHPGFVSRHPDVLGVWTAEQVVKLGLNPAHTPRQP